MRYIVQPLLRITTAVCMGRKGHLSQGLAGAVHKMIFCHQSLAVLRYSTKMPLIIEPVFLLFDLILNSSGVHAESLGGGLGFALCVVVSICGKHPECGDW